MSSREDERTTDLGVRLTTFKTSFPGSSHHIFKVICVSYRHTVERNSKEGPCFNELDNLLQLEVDGEQA